MVWFPVQVSLLSILSIKPILDEQVMNAGQLLDCMVLSEAVFLENNKSMSLMCTGEQNVHGEWTGECYAMRLTSSVTLHSSLSLWHPYGSRFIRKVPVKMKTFCRRRGVTKTKWVDFYNCVRTRQFCAIRIYRHTWGTTPKAFLHFCKDMS